MARNTEGHNLDPMTGGCVDCGATREALDDNIFPVCARFDGPHKLALIAIHQAVSREDNSIHWAARRLQDAELEAKDAELEAKDAEASAVYHARQKREFEANAAALRASLDFLASAGMSNQPKTIGLAEAIERDAPYFLRHFVTEGDQK